MTYYIRTEAIRIGSPEWDRLVAEALAVVQARQAPVCVEVLTVHPAKYPQVQYRLPLEVA